MSKDIPHGGPVQRGRIAPGYEWFLCIWLTVTPPQATIIAAMLAVLGAILGVSLGWWLFGGQVKDLKGALEGSRTLLIEHRNFVQATLKDLQEDLQERIGSLDVQVSTTMESFSRFTRYSRRRSNCSRRRPKFGCWQPKPVWAKHSREPSQRKTSQRKRSIQRALERNP